MIYWLIGIISVCVSFVSKMLHIGAGATWPGEIALRLDPAILKKLSKRLTKGVILVAGTNGKTTTSLMVKTILETHGETVIHNASGANLLNGIVSSLVTMIGTKNWGVFEVDENSIPLVLKYVQPKAIILLNLFRDQLDRYGEVDTIARNWRAVFEELGSNTTIIANADDPTVAYITQGLHTAVTYIGLEDERYYLPHMQHATDSIYCPSCGTRLTFGGFYFSHLGTWACGACGLTHPDVHVDANKYHSPLEGVYNIYNTLAAASIGELLSYDKQSIQHALDHFKAAFGRMEQIVYRGKQIRILLSKNPTGFNESIRTAMVSKAKGPLILALNDRIPDGKDVSWIWDVDFELLQSFDRDITVTGDRAYDLSVRLKYAGCDTHMIVTPETAHALDIALAGTKINETVWILATYSAMLDIRKLLTGKKIL